MVVVSFGLSDLKSFARRSDRIARGSQWTG